MLLFNLIFFLASVCLLADGARILTVVPSPSISHQVVFRPLTQELVKRGHEVVVITTDPAFPKGQTPANLTEIDLHDVSYQTWRETMFSTITTGSSADWLNQFEVFMELAVKVFEKQYMSDEVQSVIHKKNYFDLLIIESISLSSLFLCDIFKVPVISMSTFGGVLNYYDAVGAPSWPPLLYPVSIRQRLNNLSLREKLGELYNHYRFEHIFSSQIVKYEKHFKRMFGPNLPSFADLMRNVDLLFLNVHPIWEFNRPMPPNAVYLGGLHQKPTKELPQDLKSYLDSSKKGVVYISYGTNVSPSHLPPEKIQILVEAFSELPYDVLWKWDKDELPNQPQHVRIARWLPQSDLLKHPNVKLFITQGGLQSTDEAITAGVPLIGMPMLGDQWYNVEMYVYHKIGIRLDLVDVTKEAFKQAINTIVKDESYRKNIERLRFIMSDQQQQPLERAVWWTEHLLRHGGASHLKARTANMSWSEYLDLELLAVFGLCALFVLISVGLAARLLYILGRQIFFTNSKLKKS